MVFLLSNFLIGVKPFSKELQVIRALSVLVLILLSYNYYNQYYLALFIMPFSIDKITYSSDLNSEYYVKDN
jgi:hypothetical protein